MFLRQPVTNVCRQEAPTLSFRQAPAGSVYLIRTSLVLDFLFDFFVGFESEARGSRRKQPLPEQVRQTDRSE